MPIPGWVGPSLSPKYNVLYTLQENLRGKEDWRDRSAVKNMSRVTEFNSQHPYDGLEPTVTPIPGSLTPSSGLTGTRHASRAQAYT